MNGLSSKGERGEANILERVVNATTVQVVWRGNEDRLNNALIYYDRYPFNINGTYVVPNNTLFNPFYSMILYGDYMKWQLFHKKMTLLL